MSLVSKFTDFHCSDPWPWCRPEVLSEDIAMYGLIFENFSGYIKVWYYALSAV